MTFSDDELKEILKNSDADIEYCEKHHYPNYCNCFVIGLAKDLFDTRTRLQFLENPPTNLESVVEGIDDAIKVLMDSSHRNDNSTYLSSLRGVFEMNIWKELCDRNEDAANHGYGMHITFDEFNKFKELVNINQKIRRHGAHFGLLQELFNAMDELGLNPHRNEIMKQLTSNQREFSARWENDRRLMERLAAAENVVEAYREHRPLGHGVGWEGRCRCPPCVAIEAYDKVMKPNE